MPNMHMLSSVDMLNAWQVFVRVAERTSFTDGASAAGVPQPVASRRIAALERHLGQRLFDRTTRNVVVTPFGEDVLPTARRLVELAEVLEHDAVRAREAPIALALPEAPGRALAELHVAARTTSGVALDLAVAGPDRRHELFLERRVRGALLAVPPDVGRWVVPLGVAGREPPPARARIELLRPRRGQARPVLWLQPEDDVAHVRDVVERAGSRAGLLQHQVRLAASVAGATAAALLGADWLLCSSTEAGDLGLQWAPLVDPQLARGYALRADDPREAARLADDLEVALGRCVGA